MSAFTLPLHLDLALPAARGSEDTVGVHVVIRVPFGPDEDPTDYDAEIRETVFDDLNVPFYSLLYFRGHRILARDYTEAQREQIAQAYREQEEDYAAYCQERAYADVIEFAPEDFDQRPQRRAA